MPYTVTRQPQWPSGDQLVEVSAGGPDYSNPDALVTAFARLGEGQTFVSPVKAVEAAIQVCEAWRKGGAPQAQVGYGATGGMTMPFDPCTFEEARAWAVEREQGLPRCDGCGELLGKEQYRIQELDDQVFCREYCGETAWQDHCEQVSEESCEVQHDQPS